MSETKTEFRKFVSFNRCAKCSYEWQARRAAKPKVCPRCKRYDWRGD